MTDCAETSLVIKCNYSNDGFPGVWKTGSKLLTGTWFPIPVIPHRLDSDSVHTLMLYRG